MGVYLGADALGEHGVEARDADDDANFAVGEGVHQLGCAHSGAEGDGAARRERSDDAAEEWEDVVAREENHGAHVGGEDGDSVGGAYGVDVEIDVFEGEHDALGATRRAGGVDDERSVLRLVVDVGGLCVAGSVFGVGRYEEDRLVAAGSGYGFAGCGLGLLCRPNGDGLAIVDDVGEVGGGGGAVDGDCRRAVLPDGEEGVDEAWTIFGEYDHFAVLGDLAQGGELTYAPKGLVVGDFP